MCQRASDRLSSRSDSPFQLFLGFRPLGVTFDELPLLWSVHFWVWHPLQIFLFCYFLSPCALCSFWFWNIIYNILVVLQDFLLIFVSAIKHVIWFWFAWPLLLCLDCLKCPWLGNWAVKFLFYSARFLISQCGALFWLTKLFNMTLSINPMLKIIVLLIDATTNSSSNSLEGSANPTAFLDL